MTHAIASLPHLRRLSFAAGSLGLVACVVGWFVAPREFFVSYLFGFLVWLGIALGSWGFLMLHHLTGGRWGYSVRRIFEAAAGTFPMMAIFFLPILAGLHHLYPWANSASLGSNEVLQHKHVFMNPFGFVSRAVALFIIWIVISRLLTGYSGLQDGTSSPELTKRLRRLSGPGLVIYPVTVTFAYIDWVMSMEADWYSTVFPLLICVGQMLSALAFALIVLAWCGESTVLNQVLARHNFLHLGNILLALTMTWAYLAYSQLIIIWSGDLPHEIGWYLHRIAGGWRWIASVLLVFHFFGPFVFLLFRAAKQSIKPLLLVAGVIFITHIIDLWWLVAPSLYVDGFYLSWIAGAALVGIGGIWFGLFLLHLDSRPLLPLNDPRFAIAVRT